MLSQEIFNCALSGDLESLREHFEKRTVSEEEQEESLFGVRDEAGRNALMTASMFGRTDIVRELLMNGAEVNGQTVRGYSSLHLAACWGHLQTVKALLELGADTQTKTFRGERPVDLAHRYSRIDCADCLTVAEAQNDLISYLESIKTITTELEKNLTREEKRICKSACTAKSNWIQSVENPTLSDISAQRKDIEETLQPIVSRLKALTEEPPGKPE